MILKFVYFYIFNLVYKYLPWEDNQVIWIKKRDI